MKVLLGCQNSIEEFFGKKKADFEYCRLLYFFQFQVAVIVVPSCLTCRAIVACLFVAGSHLLRYLYNSTNIVARKDLGNLGHQFDLVALNNAHCLTG